MAFGKIIALIFASALVCASASCSGSCSFSNVDGAPVSVSDSTGGGQWLFVYFDSSSTSGTCVNDPSTSPYAGGDITNGKSTNQQIALASSVTYSLSGNCASTAGYSWFYLINSSPLATTGFPSSPLVLGTNNNVNHNQAWTVPGHSTNDVGLALNVVSAGSGQTCTLTVSSATFSEKIPSGC